MNLVETIKSQLSGDVLGQIGSLIGESEGNTRSAMAAAVPALLSGLSGAASTPDGASKLASTLGSLDSTFGNLGGMLGGGQGGSMLDQGGKLLNGLLGAGAVSGIVAALSRFLGLGSGPMSKLVALAAPFVLKGVGSMFKGRQITPAAVTNLFAEQKGNIASMLPAGLSLPSVANVADVRGTVDRSVQSAGPSLGKVLIPLLLLAGVGLLARWAMNRSPAVVTAPPVVRNDPAPVIRDEPAIAAPANDLTRSMEAVAPDVTQFGKDLSSVYTSATDTLMGIKDAATADAAIPKLTDLTAKLDGMKSLWDRLPAAGKSSINSMTAGGLDKIKTLVDQVTQIPGVGEKLKPILGELVTKLSGFGL